MNKTLFTNNDVKNIISNIFADNTETIKIEDGEETKNVSLADYLNIEFYSWKDRQIEQEATFVPYESWLDSLTYSLNNAYGLVEVENMELTQSPDIDTCNIFGKITFLIQANKVTNLDYFIGVLRNKYLGIKQDIINKWGETLTAYITLDNPVYDTEPMTIQNGECLLTTCTFSISYLTEALTYNDIPTYLSLDGENYYQMPYIKATWQNVFTSSPITTQTLPNRTGVVNTSMAQIKTFSFYDFNKDFTELIDELFWKIGAYSIQEGENTPVIQTEQEVQIPVWVKVVRKNKTYIFSDVLVEMEKVVTNADFNVSSITLKGNGRR